MMTMTENIVSLTTPSCLPTDAKIRPTSPRGTMPQPTIHALWPRPAAKPATSLPMTAATVMPSATTTTCGSASVCRSTCMPVSTKKTGTKK